MVDSRAKGRTAEYKVRDIFREHTKLDNWERVPHSGAGHIKGDIYLSNSKNRYCIEVKSYADDTINSNILNSSVSILEKFWEQTVRESGQANAEPLLIFKKNRGKWVVATIHKEELTPELVFNPDSDTTFYIYLLNTWLSTKNTEDFYENI